MKMDIYSKLLFNTFDVKIKDSEFIINSVNKWESVYCDPYYRDLIYKNSTLSHYIITLLEQTYYKSKITFWYETVNNIFFSQENKDKLWKHFIKAQQQYYVLSKFVTTCKYKYTKVKVDTDLNLNIITVPSNNTFKIYHDGALYYFTINDMINICNSSLTSSLVLLKFIFSRRAFVPNISGSLSFIPLVPAAISNSVKNKSK